LYPVVLHGLRIDAESRLHREAPDRMPLGKDRERLQRRRTETARPQGELRPLDRLGVLASRQELPAPGDFYHLHAVVLACPRAPQLREGGPRFGLRLPPPPPPPPPPRPPARAGPPLH